MTIRSVFGDSDGIIYVVNAAGDLLWHRHMRRSADTVWDQRNGTMIGNGWGSMLHLVTGGSGVIYGIQPTGELLWYKRTSRDADPHGKPPAHSRFKPGQSGNPKGHPKGSRNKPPALHEERLKSILMYEAYRTVKVNDGPKQASVPMAQAVVRSMALNAAKGNQRAQRLFTELLSSTEYANKALHDEWMQVAINYKVEWDRELDRRRSLGIVAPDPIPHPDHIVVDLRRGEIQIKDPMTKEEKAELELWTGRKADFEAELKELQEELEQDPEPGYRKLLEDDIEHTQRVLAAIRRIVPD